MIVAATTLQGCDNSVCVRHSDCAVGYVCNASGSCDLAPADAGSDDGGVGDAAPDAGPIDAATADGGLDAALDAGLDAAADASP